LLDAETMQLLRYLTGAAPALRDRLQARLGLKTGYNKAFLREEAIDGATVPIVRGQGLTAFSAVPDKHLLYTHDSFTGEPSLRAASACLDQLLPFRDELLARTDLKTGEPWWRIFRCPEESLGHRVAWRDIGRTLEAVALEPVIDGGPLCLNTTYTAALPGRDAALRVAAWLNGLPARFVATARADLALGGFRRYQANTVGHIPLPTEVVTGSGHLARALTLVSEELHHAPGDIALRERLDALCARLMGLSGSQFAVLRRVATELALLHGESSDPLRLRRVG